MANLDDIYAFLTSDDGALIGTAVLFSFILIIGVIFKRKIESKLSSEKKDKPYSSLERWVPFILILLAVLGQFLFIYYWINGKWIFK